MIGVEEEEYQQSQPSQTTNSQQSPLPELDHSHPACKLTSLNWTIVDLKNCLNTMFLALNKTDHNIPLFCFDFVVYVIVLFMLLLHIMNVALRENKLILSHYEFILLSTNVFN